MAKKLPDKNVYVELGERMAATLEEKASGGGGESSTFQGPSIHVVPNSLRQGNNEAYEPALVSIGPLHRSNPKLRQMEDLKWRYLQDLIDRDPKMDAPAPVQAFVDAVSPNQESARREYSVHVDLDPSVFVEMLVLDGCFLVEFLIKRAKGSVGRPLKDAKWNMPMLRKDLLLLENQIPFFVLESLFKGYRAPLGRRARRKRGGAERGAHDIEAARSDSTPPPPLALPLSSAPLRPRCSSTPLPRQLRESILEDRVRVAPRRILLLPIPAHVVMCKLPRGRRRRSPARGAAPRSIPSATKLREAGVKFERREGTRCSLNVCFSEESGALAIPHRSLQESSLSSLRNLIAFEQCCPGSEASRAYMTAYAVFMDKIIDTPEDVAVLVEDGIIEHKLGTDDDMADLFNSICEGASLDYEGHYLVGLFGQVNAYCDSDRHRWRAALVNSYFHNPWAVISIFAAFFLLLLTLGGTVASLVQTVYTVKSYHKG